jgi:V/A-type H+-transporting ATPase subunit K
MSAIVVAGTTILVALAAITGTVFLLVPEPVLAQEAVAAVSRAPEVVKWAFLAAAMSAGLSALAAGFAVAHVGSAAVGALAEKPELMGRILVLVGLAEGIAIYGLIISILILNRVA